jgi:hypothetical protein
LTVATVAPESAQHTHPRCRAVGGVGLLRCHDRGATEGIVNLPSS